MFVYMSCLTELKYMLLIDDSSDPDVDFFNELGNVDMNNYLDVYKIA